MDMSGVIPRPRHVSRLRELLSRFPVVAIVGARQTGKTTLARLLAGEIRETVTWFDLENQEDRARLVDPMLTLKALEGVAVLDEVQRMPDIFMTLRVLADRPDPPCRYLVLGSASPGLLKQTSETLAGRICYHRLRGFSVEEVGVENHLKLWRRGGCPRSYLAERDVTSMEWRRSFIGTFLERDVPQLGITVGSNTLRRFWIMLAHYHGQVWNASEFGRSFGVADTTVRHYLDILSSAFVVRQLSPWHENIKKRQVKSPKVYIDDSGILHGLLNLPSQADIESHPKLGASWEGFVIEQLVQHTGAESDECFFWATHAGAELDLLIVRGANRHGFEIKRTSAPTVTPSMRSAMKDLNLSSLDVIHAGEQTFVMSEGIRAVSIGDLRSAVDPLYV